MVFHEYDGQVFHGVSPFFDYDYHQARVVNSPSRFFTLVAAVALSVREGSGTGKTLSVVAGRQSGMAFEEAGKTAYVLVTHLF